MTQAEKAAILDTYRACLILLEHHAGICTDANTLRMDLEASIRRRMGEVEATAPDAVAAAAHQLNDKADGGKLAERKRGK